MITLDDLNAALEKMNAERKVLTRQDLISIKGALYFTMFTMEILQDYADDANAIGENVLAFWEMVKHIGGNA